jgi:PAS domain S-box-containing protein
MSSEETKLTELTFQLIVESSPNAIVLVNKEGKIAYFNSRAELLFGYVRADVIGQLVELLIPKRYHENHPGFRDIFFKTPSVRAMGAGRELFAARKDKTEFPIEIGLNPIVTVDGTLVLASIIDITERKKAEERFKLVVESAPNAMILVNRQGIITLINTQTEKLFGYERDELVGNKLEMLIPKRFQGHHPGHWNLFFKEPQTPTIEVGRDLFGLRKDGAEIPVEIGLNPIETNEGNMVLASFIDITERIQHERVIKKQLSELKIANDYLEQLAYISAHDIKNPIISIEGLVDILLDSSEIKPPEVELLKMQKGVIQQMKKNNKGINDILKLRQGLLTRQDADAESMSLTAILDSVKIILRSDIESTGSKLKVNMNGVSEIHFPFFYLQSVFYNLLANAIKYRDPGRELIIRFEAQRIDKQAFRFVIADNGLGFDMSRAKDKLFGVFKRFHPNIEGTGLGLHIVKSIVDAYGGEIAVNSEVGKGTTFEITLKNPIIE